MPPEDRFVCRFAAEPPQERLPYGGWAQTLRAEFLAACLRIETRARSSASPARSLVPRSHVERAHVRPGDRAARRAGLELYGDVSFVAGARARSPRTSRRPPTGPTETAEANPEWQIDLCEEVVGGWRGDGGSIAAMTLVWGTPLRRPRRVATAELADLAVDQCALVEDRFTLLAPDDYRGDTLDVSSGTPAGASSPRSRSTPTTTRTRTRTTRPSCSSAAPAAPTRSSARDRRRRAPGTGRARRSGPRRPAPAP